LLAGGLRYVGGFAKDTTPFSEFLWADFLRRRMKRKMVETDCDGALEQALSGRAERWHTSDAVRPTAHGWDGKTKTYDVTVDLNKLISVPDPVDPAIKMEGGVAFS
jgi:hypothetical protein